ncbi:hypothetical protein GCM10018790_10450 [Kitasatospora xanthocidica]|nr:hypothetical protein GCM10018790_10450 [Kitasatospora xanthocidica]
MLVQPGAGETARFAVQACGQSGTELRASHITIVPHGRRDGVDRVGAGRYGTEPAGTGYVGTARVGGRRG